MQPAALPRCSLSSVFHGFSLIHGGRGIYLDVVLTSPDRWRAHRAAGPLNIEMSLALPARLRTGDTSHVNVKPMSHIHTILACALALWVACSAAADSIGF